MLGIWNGPTFSFIGAVFNLQSFSLKVFREHDIDSVGNMIKHPQHIAERNSQQTNMWDAGNFKDNPVEAQCHTLSSSTEMLSKQKNKTIWINK